MKKLRLISTSFKFIRFALALGFLFSILLSDKVPKAKRFLLFMVEMIDKQNLFSSIIWKFVVSCKFKFTFTRKFAAFVLLNVIEYLQRICFMIVYWKSLPFYLRCALVSISFHLHYFVLIVGV